ncbi:coatomer WDAD alpha [Babesia gibsoni]|uniref:Coatomer WDAD alpha n=1 Tax=Babesia gibsoni TaxID=33632 RepID=A0AAD8UQR3_BABGI|nr:coatomer WDAD alpha [Babesia gibsoni]
MLIKCKTKSTRVKGIAFHPKLPFILASMHHGDIQLWNYLNSTLVDVFTFHEGPVRGIDFHELQPLFVSGGDDTNIVVWDFKQKKMMFVLTGHTDYIRTVQFHSNYPWIVSASDDQTVRIWNWQARNCVTVLQGHNHYVMCARFHPRRDLIVSASLDHTIRIWDATVLREKNCAMQGLGNRSSTKLLSNFRLITPNNETAVSNDHSKHVDRISFTDVTCLYTLTGHNKGVNWATFHDKLPLVISGGDDKTIRAWRFNGPDAWQTNILRGHQNNVCSVIMHPNNVNYLFSVSEDRSIRVWDTRKWALSHTFMLENDRFWIIQRARNSNYIAAGHDSGFIVFKLFKERPIVTLIGNTLYYAWNDVIYASNLEAELERTVEETPHSALSASQPSESSRENEYQNTEMSGRNQLDFDGLLEFGGDTQQHSLEDEQTTQIRDDLVFPSPAGEHCKANRTHIATLCGADDSDSVVKKFIGTLLLNTPIPTAAVRSGGLIHPFCIYYNNYCSDKSLLLVNYTFKGKSFYEIVLRGFSSVVAAQNRTTLYMGEALSACFASRTSVAAVGPTHKVFVHSLGGDVVANMDLGVTVDKVFPICVNIVLIWANKDNKVILYDVASDAKVAEANSCHGKLCNVFVSKSKKLIALVFKKHAVIYDRALHKLAAKEMQGKIKTAAWYENTALFFATSDRIYYLMVNDDFGVLKSIEEPLYIVKVKENFIYYMQRNHMCYKMDVHSDELMFKIALYQNNMELATKLIEAGKIHGNATVSYLVKKGYPLLARMIMSDPVMRFELALSFGNIADALEDAQVIDKPDAWRSLGNAALEQGNCTIAELAFQKAKLFNKLSMLYMITGNTNRLKKMLNICKFCNDLSGSIQHCLYLGDMKELASVLKENGQGKLAEICESTYGIDDKVNEANNEDARYMVPPQPVVRATGDELNWPVIPLEVEVKEAVYYDDADPAEVDFDDSVEEAKPPAATVNQDIWGTIDELNPLDSIEAALNNQHLSNADSFAPAVKQNNLLDPYKSPLDYISAGNVDKALDILERSLGLCDRKAMEEVVANMYEVSQNNDKFHADLLSTDPQQLQAGISRPLIDHEFVKGIMNKGYANVTSGSFEDAITEFRLALSYWIFLVSDTSRDYIDMCRIYITAMLLESEREKLANSDIRRSLELAAYFSCCDMLPQHRYLVLRRTMGIMWKAQNYITAAKLVTRFMAQDVSNIEGAEEEMQKAKKIYDLCEQKGIETYTLDFDQNDEHNLRICTVSLVKTKGSPIVHCRFCNAIALEQFRSQKCNICQLCQLCS